MIRASLGDQAYWDKWTRFNQITIEKKLMALRDSSKNPAYEPQFVWNLTLEYSRSIITRYSRGDLIPELAQDFAGLLDAWELSNKLAVALNANLQSGEGWDHRHRGTAPLVTNNPCGHNDPRAWVFNLANLNHYNWCFWLVGLGLTLNIPESQWRRLLALIGEEGKDILLDRVISSRQPERMIGQTLLHKKPYARLLKAIDAPISKQAGLLLDFLIHWYTELARQGAEELWWYNFGDPVQNPLEKGSYFGRWCIEAAAAVKAFGLDDSQCLGHEHYPGDLLRPEGPSTHPVREHPRSDWLTRVFGRRSH